jgi:hypothetical protein
MQPGPAPRPADQKVTRHQPKTEWVDVRNVPFDGSQLPTLRPEVVEWAPTTLM